MAPVELTHAAAMDDVYRYQRYIYDITRRYYLFGRDACVAALNVTGNETIVEIGCGTGRNLIHVARRYPQAQLFGFDISQEMLTTATRSIRSHGLAQRIMLKAADATTFDASALFSVEQVDRQFASYVLSMIPDWQDVMARAAAHVPPGGAFHIVDFGDMAGLPKPARDAMRAWLRRFHVTPRTELFAIAHDVANAYGLRVACRHGRFNYSAHVALSRT